MGRFNFNFELFAIDFAHSFDFSKDNSISIIKPVLLFFVKANKTSFFLCDSSDVNRFWFFTGGIEDAVAVSEVNKSETVESKIAGIDEPKIFFMESFVQFDKIVSIVVIKDYYAFIMTNSKWEENYIDSIESSVAIPTWTLELRSFS